MSEASKRSRCSRYAFQTSRDSIRRPAGLELLALDQGGETLNLVQAGIGANGRGSDLWRSWRGFAP
jgi:hypothetical protein